MSLIDRWSLILITGATGTNGLEIVKLLSKKGLPNRAMARSAEKADVLADLPGVEIVQGDFERPETLMPALRGIDKALLISSIDPGFQRSKASSLTLRSAPVSRTL